MPAGFDHALALFHAAAKRVPAYRQFLHEQGFDPRQVRRPADFRAVPCTDKESYFRRFSLAELSWDGKLAPAKHIAMSSGSSGTAHFWPRGEAQDEISGALFQQLYEKIFDTRTGTTLFLNCFALGAWMAGIEVYGATKYTADRGNPIVITTPSIDMADAIRTVTQLAASFDRVVLAGYPPFIKDILERGADAGVRWDAMDTRLLVAGEAISERWRDRVLELIGKPNDVHALINLYGMAEVGAVAHETPPSIALRRAPERANLDGARINGLFQYSPVHRFFESGTDDALVLTAPGGLPLIRYNTRDEGGLLSVERARGLGIDLGRWPQPFVYLYGRRDLSISFYALLIYVEQVKAALEDSAVARDLSGLFTMSTELDERFDQQFELVIELGKGVPETPTLADSLRDHVAAKLLTSSTEYAKLHAALGARALPRIRLLPFGELHARPGRKHRWVKRP